PGVFGPEELDGLPEPVRRHLAQAIAPGTPLARSARLRMQGQIKVGRWMPFRAREVLAPHEGFAWTARAAGLITGADHYAGGEGGMEWKLAGLLTVMRGESRPRPQRGRPRGGGGGLAPHRPAAAVRRTLDGRR